MDFVDTNAENKEAADYQGALALNERKAAAYNAFNAQYGPGPAGDPAAALQLQSYGQHQQTDPIQVQQDQADLTGKNLTNTGLQQTNAFAASADPLKLTGLGLANTDAADKNAQTEQTTRFAAQDQPLNMAKIRADTSLAGAEAGNASASAAQTRQTTAMTGSNAEQTAKLGMVNQLMQAKQQASAVPGATPDSINAAVQTAFQQMAPQLKTMTGVTPSHIDALGARLSEPGFLENAAGMLSGTVVGQKGMEKLPLSDGTGYRLVPAGSVPKAGPGVQNVVDPKTGQVTQRTIGMAQSPQATAIAKADLGQMDLGYSRTNDVLNKALALVNARTTGLGAETLGHLPGTDALALQDQVNGAKGNTAILYANAMRQNGAKSAPIPVRNMAEFKAYQDALGVIDVRASPAVVRSQIQDAQTRLSDLQSAMHAAFGAKYGMENLPSGSPAAPATSAAPAGWAIKQVP